MSDFILLQKIHPIFSNFIHLSILCLIVFIIKNGFLLKVLLQEQRSFVRERYSTDRSQNGMSCQFDENGAFLRQQNIVPFYCKYRISGKLSCISEAMGGKKMSKIVHSKCDCDLNLNCALDKTY